MTGPFIRFGTSILWQQAQMALAQRQLNVARTVLSRLKADVTDDNVHSQLLAAQIAVAEGRVRNASAHALGAAAASPDDFKALCAIAGVLMSVGERVAASVCLDRLPQDQCNDPLLLMHAADLRKRLEQPEESLSLLNRAKSLGDINPALRYCHGVALIANGRLVDAEFELATSFAQAPSHGVIAVPLVRLRRQTPDSNFLDAIESGLRRTDVAPPDRAAFEFARYKTLEDLERYTEAGMALANANHLMFARLGNDAAALHATLDRLLEAQPLTAGSIPSKRVDDGPRPVFIVGFPRSGTTLLERMLGNHPSVATAGELVDFRLQVHWLADASDLYSNKLIARLSNIDYAELGRRYLAQTRWRAKGKPIYVDKQPPNWLLVGAIHASLPRARIINLVRDPIDICFSNWRLFFGETCGYSYDLRALATHCNDYSRAMAHWHRALPGTVLDVRYTDLVTDPEAVLQRVFAFCDIPSQAGCSDLTRNHNPITTPSAAQVRGPLTRDNGGRWQHYTTQLAPLLDTLKPASAPSV
ncbi:MAG TPA: sulfotransferase [Rhodanobacteraceae bacterium]